ncbi:DUF6904 family protein [Parafilimonas terrae]|uniref:Uncharacterized protein n=1 Tax=Parafilimonas terrae TaxID=1465490 RepID=A0A1I5TAB0_9BACT|nr:hypothetical protein [Parafilimonas terrae]SFP79962.1 hypothetical protein SAMN05444277_10215 [Parafilimonas terrae]
MLQAYHTKNGTGISIFGNYGELNLLYDIIHHIANSLDQKEGSQEAQFQLLMNFAYEVRKATSGQRLKEQFTFDGDDVQHTLYGFQLVWTDILILISALRHNAGYTSTDKLQQAILYQLEYITELALFEYDPVGANDIKDLIARGINVSSQYAFNIYQALHIKYVTEKAGKSRFRKIPELIDTHFSEWRQEHKNLVASFQRLAKEQNCAIADLEFSDFPEIVW